MLLWQRRKSSLLICNVMAAPLTLVGLIKATKCCSGNRCIMLLITELWLAMVASCVGKPRRGGRASLRRSGTVLSMCRIGVTKSQLCRGTPMTQCRLPLLLLRVWCSVVTRMCRPTLLIIDAG